MFPDCSGNRSIVFAACRLKEKATLIFHSIPSILYTIYPAEEEPVAYPRKPGATTGYNSIMPFYHKAQLHTYTAGDAYNACLRTVEETPEAW